MKMISEYMGERISFVQISVFKRFHELRVNDEKIGSLRQVGFFGMKWEASIQNKKWEIYKPSFWRASLSIREEGFELPFATFTRDGFRNKGTISLPRGETLKIIPRLFKRFCEILNEHGECLAKIIPKKISFTDKAEVTIEKKDELLDKYPWIIMMAYIIITEQRHRAAH